LDAILARGQSAGRASAIQRNRMKSGVMGTLKATWKT